LSDDIAYLSHDIDDALRAEILSLGDLVSAPLAGAIMADLLKGVRMGDAARAAYEVSRRMITIMIRDLVEETRRRLARLAPSSPDDIRAAPEATAAFSAGMAADITGLRAFLMDRVYRSPRVMHVMGDAEAIVEALFTRYLADPATMPQAWQAAAREAGDRKRARIIGDFVAGMTDRYAIAEHGRLFDATPELR
jgi:dGTPase